MQFIFRTKYGEKKIVEKKSIINLTRKQATNNDNKQQTKHYQFKNYYLKH